MAVSLVTRAVEPIPYAQPPNDPYFFPIGTSLPGQWYLEGLRTNGTRYAIDINARSAWSLSRGEGVTIAIVDTGVDVAHPDLINQQNAALHWNFEADVPFGNPPSAIHNHGTPVAGLAVAEGYNNRGVVGAAPEAEFASWVIYRTNSNFVPNTQLAKMFEYKIQDVEVQNHSWVLPGVRPVVMSAAEDLAISNAVYNGRGGKGVVMVRASGNSRGNGDLNGRNANEDEYMLDHRVITAAAIDYQGRAAWYSTPGAPILVAAPGGDDNLTLMTTDRSGDRAGYNEISFQNDLADYVYHSLGFAGTSASTPLVSGVVAMMLSANPSLTVRDVQHLLVQSAYHSDPNDPDLIENGAGFPVTHNVGFGTVNAGSAVQLATLWPGVPGAVSVTNSVQGTTAIPDAGYRLLTSGPEVPTELQSIVVLPSAGMFAEEGTPQVPLVYVGRAIEPLTNDLTGKAALIQRGAADFSVKIQHAADAGAVFAIIFNNQGSNVLKTLGGTDFVPIPAISITQREGDALAALATNSTVQARIAHDKAQMTFSVTNALITEHVLLHLDLAHQTRAHLRVSLVSPTGVRSVLQRLGDDTNAFIGRWTYMTTHHFYESPIGAWRLEVSDQFEGGVGVINGAELEIRGIPITDTDRDGLHDAWEQTHFTNLISGPKDDPDSDGFSNAREQMLQFNPRANDAPLKIDLSKWSDYYVRLNWPARSGVQYEVYGATDLAGEFTSLGIVTGGFPRVAFFSRLDQPFRFYRVEERPAP
ncbi:MAG TPA: S8 family serine peptidase [Verrucomicrobiae bacterium]